MKLTAKLADIFRSEYVHAVQLDQEMIGAALCKYKSFRLTKVCLCGALIDAECFFPDCLQSLKAVDLVGADDDNEVILVKSYRVEINSYRFQDHKVAQIHEALSLCGEAILLPSTSYNGAWER